MIKSACWVIFNAYLSSADFFKINFSKKNFRNTIRVSNSLEPNQGQQNGENIGHLKEFFLKS